MDLKIRFYCIWDSCSTQNIQHTAACQQTSRNYSPPKVEQCLLPLCTAAFLQGSVTVLLDRGMCGISLARAEEASSLLNQLWCQLHFQSWESCWLFSGHLRQCVDDLLDSSELAEGHCDDSTECEVSTQSSMSLALNKP